MSKVVNFTEMKDRQKNYKQVLAELDKYLEGFEEELISRAVNIAIADKWYNWDQSVPVGTRMEFDEEMLYDCGDKNVTAILDLHGELEKLRETLQPLND